MARNKRAISAFSLSFLDIMSCGFGAVILLFLIIKHNIDTNVPIPVDTDYTTSEVRLLEEEINDGRKNLAEIRNTIAEIDQRLVVTQGLANRIMEEKRETAALTEELRVDTDSAILESMKSEIRSLERQKIELEQELERTGEQARRIEGEGRRQYLTGLTVNGRRILVLLDISASMLDETIVNIIRYRNVRDELKRTAEKWRKAVRIVEWLSAQFPIDSKFQIYGFNTDADSVLPGTTGEWLDVRDSVRLKEAVEHLDLIVPEDGTNLDRAFSAAAALRPLPDSIFLITDGLPTQGPGAPGTPTITSRDRLKVFSRALRSLPSSVPVNVILTPLEGDPEAGPAFWSLARSTNGAFMSPSGDWP